jgi:uncharacterized protein
MSDTRPFTAASFNQYLSEGKLMASYCPDSDRTYLPPRAICPETHSDTMQWVALSGQGTLAAFTSIVIAPPAMVAQGYGRDNPYLAGIVELDEGVRISARILGLDASQPDVGLIGTPLAVDFIASGDGDDAQTVLAFRAEE